MKLKTIQSLMFVTGMAVATFASAQAPAPAPAAAPQGGAPDMGGMGGMGGF